MVTIKDVSVVAGVSTATVSKVLSNPTWGKPETRAKVMETVERLQYTPNALARQLRIQETRIILAVVPNLRNTLFHKLVFGIEREAQKKGYQVFIANAYGQTSIDGWFLDALKSSQVDGVISMSSAVAQQILQSAPSRYPLVLAVQDLGEGSVPTVGIDNFCASFEMACHLLRKGHRVIAHLTATTDLGLYRERLRGYRLALSEAGLPVEEGLVSRGEESLRGGYEQMEALLARRTDFTAVMAAGDTMAIGAIAALRRHGIRVPEDVAVTGFDDLDIAAYYSPTLTTVRQPAQEMGECAFRKLLGVLRKEEPMPSSEILAHELVVRESCGSAEVSRSQV